MHSLFFSFSSLFIIIIYSELLSYFLDQLDYKVFFLLLIFFFVCLFIIFIYSDCSCYKHLYPVQYSPYNHSSLLLSLSLVLFTASILNSLISLSRSCWLVASTLCSPLSLFPFLSSSTSFPCLRSRISNPPLLSHNPSSSLLFILFLSSGNSPPSPSLLLFIVRSPPPQLLLPLSHLFGFLLLFPPPLCFLSHFPSLFVLSRLVAEYRKTGSFTNFMNSHCCLSYIFS